MRVLADTSIWADHFRAPSSLLTEQVAGDLLLIHPMVVGELAMGNLPRRQDTLRMLDEIDDAVRASDTEVMSFIEQHRLHGRGLSWVDVHLLVSAMLSECGLWTRDRRLNEAARHFHCATQLHH